MIPKKKKIMIVEDEKILADMYKDKLSRSGFDVECAFNAEDGFNMIKKAKPDLVLLDILLPRENGISLLSKIRKEKDISSVPVIAFSNYDDQGTKEEAKNFGAKEYLIKTNYNPQEILDIINKYIN